MWKWIRIEELDIEKFIKWNKIDKCIKLKAIKEKKSKSYGKQNEKKYEIDKRT